MSDPPRLLRRLARLYGVQTVFTDLMGKAQAADEETLISILRAIGAPITRLEDVPDAVRWRRRELWRRPIDPVNVVWEGDDLDVRVRLPAPRIAKTIPWTLEFENADIRRSGDGESPHRAVRRAEVEGVPVVELRLEIKGPFPPGYHRLRIEVGKERLESFVLSAPKFALVPQRESKKTWGVFVPTYALHSRRSWGAGDLADLEAVMEWVNTLGGRIVGTLPLLAAYLDDPCDPSPYAPVTRLLWNEFYVDVGRVPELAHSSEAQHLIDSPSFRREIEALRGSPLVDYRRQMALKRRIFQLLARTLYERKDEERFKKFQHFVKTNPAVRDYARFRATTEQKGTPWTEWPAQARDGRIRPGDYDEDSNRYHLYAQWIAQEQISELASRARGPGEGLYLDLPLGVHAHGYDVWRERDVFASRLTTGAPPDDFFSQGQNWGFPPYHPEKPRETQYRYFIQVIRHHMKSTGLLRIDHVMGFHRLYCVPHGHDARHGAYVRLPHREYYAILTIESHRNGTVIIGEDLGTVPAVVREAMTRHRLFGMYAAQIELRADSDSPLRPIPGDVAASVNTHDMPTFQAYWDGLDIQDRVEMGLLESADAGEERLRRQRIRRALIDFLEREKRLSGSEEPSAVLLGLLSHLSGSRAPVMLVSLEDLWLEPRPQNVPGTGFERPNWRRKLRYPLEEMMKIPHIILMLQRVNEARARRTS